jgi:phage I-like protein
MDAELATTVCRLVAGLVVSDDEFSREEEAFIGRMLKRFGIDDRTRMFPILDQRDAEASIRALPTAVQEEALATLIEAAAADGRVVDEERGFLLAVGEAMGLDAAAVEERIGQALAALR